MSIKSMAERFGTLSIVTFSEAYSIFPTWHVDDQYSKYSLTGSSNLHEAKNKIEQSKKNSIARAFVLGYIPYIPPQSFLFLTEIYIGRFIKSHYPKGSFCKSQIYSVAEPVVAAGDSDFDGRTVSLDCRQCAHGYLFFYFGNFGISFLLLELVYRQFSAFVKWRKEKDGLKKHAYLRQKFRRIFERPFCKF